MKYGNEQVPADSPFDNEEAPTQNKLKSWKPPLSPLLRRICV
jgi:hypothetical protein